MARTKQRRTYLPFLASCNRYSFTDHSVMEGWVSPGPGCKEQLAHDCYATTCGQRDWNPDCRIESPARWPLGYRATFSGLYLAVRWIAVTSGSIIVCICSCLDASTIECRDWLRWSTVTCLEQLPRSAGPCIPHDSLCRKHTYMINWETLQKVYIYRPVLDMLRCRAIDTLWGSFVPAASRDMQDDRSNRMNS